MVIPEDTDESLLDTEEAAYSAKSPGKENIDAENLPDSPRLIVSEKVVKEVPTGHEIRKGVYHSIDIEEETLRDSRADTKIENEIPVDTNLRCKEFPLHSDDDIEPSDNPLTDND